MILRKITTSILEMLNKFPILVLTGPRQSGKTTLLRNIFSDYRYVNFEDADQRAFFNEDPRGFLKLYDNKVIFDEAQRVPELFSRLQVKTDEDNVMGQFILSGSQHFLLLEKTSQSLAGRVALFNLLPFSHTELSEVTPSLLPIDANLAIFQGGYPALFSRKIKPSQYFPSYVETYLERDVRNVSNVQDLTLFRNFLRLCAGRVGQPVNFQSLGVECGISSPTVKKWLAILEASFILFQLPPYFENFNQRLIKSPKFYFYDTGLLCYLLNLTDPNQIDQYYNRGSLFENMVILELMKSRFNSFLPANFYFWKDSNAVEVDLVIQENAKTHLVEIKFSQTPKADFLKGLSAFRLAAPLLKGDSFVIYAGDVTQPRSVATILPWKEMKDV
jgi:uncharacterized protein